MKSLWFTGLLSLFLAANPAQDAKLEGVPASTNVRVAAASFTRKPVPRYTMAWFGP